MSHATTQFWGRHGNLLLSYLMDLKDADVVGRNLIAAKYGHMTESTSPQEYKKLKHLLQSDLPKEWLSRDE